MAPMHCNGSSWLDRIQNSDTSTSNSTNQAFLFKFTFMLCGDSVLHSFFVASEFKWGKFRPNMAERSQRRDQFFRNKPNVWPYLRPQNALCPDIRCCCKINIPHTCRLNSLKASKTYRKHQIMHCTTVKHGSKSVGTVHVTWYHGGT